MQFNCILLYETKKKEAYFKSREQKIQSALIPEVNGQTAASTLTLI